MSDINLTQITNSTIVGEGEGIFDKLMQVVNLHIDAQHEKGRIKGPEYAQVYIAAIQAVLQQSIAFTLGEQTADKQAELLVVQIAEQLAATARNDATSLLNDALILEKTESENKQNITDGILDKQLADIVAGTTLKGSQNAEVLAATIRNDAESTVKTALTVEQTESEAKQNAVDGVIDKQVLDIVAGTVLKTSQNTEVLSSTVRQDIESTSKIALQTEQISASQSDTSRQDTESTSKVGLLIEQTETEAKKNVLDGIMDKQVLDIVAGITLKGSQNLEVLAGTSRNDLQSAKDLLVKQEGLELTVLQQSTEGFKAAEVQSSTSRQVAESSAKITLLTEQTESEDMKNKIDGILQNQITQIKEETSLTVNKTATELKQALVLVEQVTSSTAKTLRDNAAQASTEAVNDQQILKLVEDTTLVTEQQLLTSQKAVTELAQTTDINTVPYGTSGNALTGVLGAQQSLYKMQTKGFVAKHKKDVLKDMMDAWSVRHSLVNGTTAVPSFLTETDTVFNNNVLDNYILDVQNEMGDNA